MSDDLDLAMAAAVAGSRLAMSYVARMADVGHSRKPDGSLVTDADQAVETAIAGMLSAGRPGDAVLGEEGGQRGGGDRRWIIDPIDGTAEFAAGTDRWLVLVALEISFEVAVAVAAAPAQRRLWWAARGAGAFVADLTDSGPGEPRRITTRPRAAPDLTTSRLGVVPEPTRPTDHQVIGRLAAVTAPQPWRTHPGLLVASGDLDIAVQTRGKIWDYAVPSLIVTEAGGRFSGFDGRHHPHTGPALYSSDPDAHRAALAYLTN
jgi:histidinol-phosphatase